MEKNITMRRAVAMVGLGIGSMSLLGCSTGQVDAPTIQELQSNGEFFELTRPDGSVMECWQFGARGEGVYGESPSWFGISCDWDNAYPLGE